MSKGKLLLVENNATFRSFLTAELSMAGYSVTDVGDTERFFKALREDYHHVILLDTGMPKMDCVDTMNFLKQSQILSEVIVFTDNTMIENALECIKLGAFDYMCRPYPLKKFISCVGKAMEHQQSKVQ
ncbi:MAG: response regulator [Chitinispirillales bacterium]|jgi:two-component system NtrC family response regulator/two-component system response regulator AtoC|nr:response regulator [Chitinispirillales bacterium]